jgi:hypothetical protein
MRFLCEPARPPALDVTSPELPTCFTVSHSRRLWPIRPCRSRWGSPPACSVTPAEDGFQIKANMVEKSARDLNRTLLSALRKVGKKTRLRAAWAFGKSIERFFDYGLRALA